MMLRRKKVEGQKVSGAQLSSTGDHPRDKRERERERERTEKRKRRVKPIALLTRFTSSYRFEPPSTRVALGSRILLFAGSCLELVLHRYTTKMGKTGQRKRRGAGTVRAFALL
jgi:hypothetical protein